MLGKSVCKAGNVSDDRQRSDVTSSVRKIIENSPRHAGAQTPASIQVSPVSPQRLGYNKLEISKASIRDAVYKGNQS